MVLSGDVKQLGHEADHSPLSSVETKHSWALPPCCFAQLMKHRDNFILPAGFIYTHLYTTYDINPLSYDGDREMSDTAIGDISSGQ
jgi:hypothetical protein